MGIGSCARQLVEAAIWRRDGCDPGGSNRHGAGDKGDAVEEGLETFDHCLLSPDSRRRHVPILPVSCSCALALKAIGLAAWQQMWEFAPPDMNEERVRRHDVQT